MEEFLFICLIQGLLKIPFEYCVSRDSTNEIFIEDIPDQKEEITVDKMDDKK